MAGKATTEGIQRTSARLRRFVTGLLLVLVVLLFLERFGAVGLQLIEGGFGGEGIRRLAFELVAACPEMLYLLSLWWIRQALSEFAGGKLYTPSVRRMLDRVGTTLAAGALISVFLVPSASRALGFGPGYWIAYDVSALVLGAIGLSLKVIAHVLRLASEMQVELDEIF
jgi:hypothetical protein